MLTSRFVAFSLRTSLLLLVGLALWAWSPQVVDSQPRSPRCSVESTGLSFGAYNVFDALPLDAVGTLVIECSGLGPGAQVAIGLGRGNEREHLKRALRHKRFALRYQVYLDAARTLVWGDGSGGTSLFRTRPPNGRALSIPMFGRIPALQSVTPGSYSDQLVVSVDY